jgi:hypothetical protein
MDKVDDAVTPQVSSSVLSGPLEKKARELWKRFELAGGIKPLAGAVIIGGVAIALAVEFGPIELGLGAFAAYTLYRVMRFGIGVREALLETAEIEHGIRH